MKEMSIGFQSHLPIPNFSEDNFLETYEEDER